MSKRRSPAKNCKHSYCTLHIENIRGEYKNIIEGGEVANRGSNEGNTGEESREGEVLRGGCVDEKRKGVFLIWICAKCADFNKIRQRWAIKRKRRKV